MFDKLVESTSTGAELKPRRRIFAATLVLVTTLFATAVVASIYAADFDLGASEFDMAELLTPITETEPKPEPEPEQPEPRRSNLPQSASNEIVRPVLIASTDDFTRVPKTTSSEANPYASIPPGKYDIARTGPIASDPGPVGPGRGDGTGSAQPGFNADEPDTKTPPPAPPKAEKKPPVISGGPMTGKATHLPKPTYSAAAKAVGAQGAVAVQILVDETGKVISAKAVSGHPMLRSSAVDAAWKAKFNPTTLSNVPVKVTGVITYNFTKN